MSAMCSVPGCVKKSHATGMCNVHYMRVRRHGGTDALIATQGSGYLARGYKLYRSGAVRRLEHVMVVEKAIGRRLQGSETIHHVDEVKSNNVPTNLVVCPNHKYHMMLHVRTRAYDACGNANYRKCKYCKQYSDPVDLYINGRNSYHNRCAAAFNKLAIERRRNERNS